MPWGELLVLLCVGGFLLFILTSHEARLRDQAEDIKALETFTVAVDARVEKLLVGQARCQEQMTRRLEEGKQSFDRISTTLSSMSNMANRLEAVSNRLQEQVNIIDNRLYEHQGRGKDGKQGL